MIGVYPKSNAVSAHDASRALGQVALNHAPQKASQLRIACFGTFRISYEGKSISLRRTGKGITILKYLASRNGPVLRDVLLEAIWPETDPEVASNRLRVAIHRLRQTFAPMLSDDAEGDVIIRTEDGYALNPTLDIVTDVQAFEFCWETGKRLDHMGRLAEAIPFYLEAQALYQGDLLEEDLFEEWTFARRDRLKDIYLHIMDRLSQHWLQSGNTEQAIEGWKDVLACDPLREDVYRRLMEVYAQQGQRALAVRVFTMCKTVLEQELQVEPDPETVALYERIRQGERKVKPLNAAGPVTKSPARLSESWKM